MYSWIFYYFWCYYKWNIFLNVIFRLAIASVEITSFTLKTMAIHSSTLAWKIPWTEEPGRLQSMGSWRVGHDWVTSLSLFIFMHWRRKWQPTPVFLPGESQRQGSLVGYHLWGRRVGHDWRDLAAAAAAFPKAFLWCNFLSSCIVLSL